MSNFEGSSLATNIAIATLELPNSSQPKNSLITQPSHPHTLLPVSSDLTWRTDMPPKRSTRARTKAARPTAHEAFIDDAADDGLEQLPLSDEEDDRRSTDKKIIARDGQLGFSNPKKGFDSRTNFTLDIVGDIYSVEYQLKGNNSVNLGTL